MSWTPILVAAIGCALLKQAGWSLPRHWLEHERLQRVAALMPLALLAALVAVQAFGGADRTLVLDARSAGLAVAAGLLAVRAPFLVVIGGAAATAALLRAVG
jgi:hypothetical protein